MTRHHIYKRSISILKISYPILFGALFSGLIFLFLLKLLPSSKLAVHFYSFVMQQRCRNSESHLHCYTQEIPILMSQPFNLSMEDTFIVTRLVQQQDQSFPYCHVLGHKLGAIELSRNPDNWKELISHCPIGYCNNGCIHGVLQERFKAESFNEEELEAIKPDLTGTLCQPRANWNPTVFEKTECYHALGHLSMYLTNGNIKRSLDLCDEFVLFEKHKPYALNCYDGSFMILYQPLEPEDHALSRGKTPGKDQVISFCNQFINGKKDSCLTESWPLMISELYNPDLMEKFCSGNNISDYNRCYSVLISAITTIHYKFNAEEMKNYCQKLPPKENSKCLEAAALKFVITNYQNIPKAVDMCNKSESLREDSSCFKRIGFYIFSSFKLNSDEYKFACQNLPPKLTKECTI